MYSHIIPERLTLQNVCRSVVISAFFLASRGSPRLTQKMTSKVTMTQ